MIVNLLYIVYNVVVRMLFTMFVFFQEKLLFVHCLQCCCLYIVYNVVVCMLFTMFVFFQGKLLFCHPPPGRDWRVFNGYSREEEEKEEIEEEGGGRREGGMEEEEGEGERRERGSQKVLKSNVRRFCDGMSRLCEGGGLSFDRICRNVPNCRFNHLRYIAAVLSAYIIL